MITNCNSCVACKGNKCTNTKAIEVRGTNVVPTNQECNEYVSEREVKN